MKKIAVFYGSTTGNTKDIAKAIAEKLDADIFDVSDTPSKQMEQYDNLILGTSTWGSGDIQDDWDSFLENMETICMEDKCVAIFGLGDSMTYADTFVDGIGAIYHTIKDKGCKIIGKTDISDYDFEDSSAVIDNKFAGLPLDEDNESHLTAVRIDQWVNQIKNQFC